jgi:hypothetical protein
MIIEREGRGGEGAIRRNKRNKYITEKRIKKEVQMEEKRGK